MNSLTELNTIQSQLEAPERLKEMENEDSIKRDIQRGKCTKTISNKYNVLESFVIKCRKELREENQI